MSAPYLDTSALAKWYFNEPGSTEFEAFIRCQTTGLISRLTVVEIRSLVSRRRRMGEIDARLAKRILVVFDADIVQGFLTVQPLADIHAQKAAQLIDFLRDHPLRTLDALHLAVALDTRVKVMATADRILGEAAVTVGLKVVRFDR